MKKNQGVLKERSFRIYYFLVITISLLITLYYLIFEGLITLRLFLILSFFALNLFLLSKKSNFNLFSFVFFALQAISVQFDSVLWSFLFGPDLQVYFSLSNEFYVSFNFLFLNYDISFLYKKIFLENFISVNLLHLIMAIYYFDLMMKPQVGNAPN